MMSSDATSTGSGHSSTRSADAVIRGFFAQATWTALRWAEADRDTKIVCEGREDIDRHILDDQGALIEFTAEQVKDLAGAISARTPAVYDTLFCFLTAFHEAHQAEDASSFVFTTSTTRSDQQLQKGKPGEISVDILQAWETYHAKKDQEVLSQLKKALGQLIDVYCKDPKDDGSGASEKRRTDNRKWTKGKVVSAFQYVVTSDETFSAFLSSVCWQFQQPAGEELQQRLEDHLSQDERTKDLPARDLARRLIYEVLVTSSKPVLKDRVLSWEGIEYLAQTTMKELEEWGRRVHSDRLDGWMERIEARLSALEDAQRIALVLPRIEATRTVADLKYQARAVPLVGRDDVLDRLKEFVQHDDVFRWWSVGGRGGEGKSRLALDLCLKCHELGWDAGFYLEDRAPASLRVDRATLIVVDYALGREGVVGDVFARLDSLAEHPKVRLLLLERDVDAILSKVQQTPTLGAQLAQTHHGDPIRLSSLSRNDYDAVAHAYQDHFELTAEQRKRVQKSLAELQGQPPVLMAGLFSLFYAHADAEEEAPTDLTSLVAELVARERERWIRQCLPSEDAENALVLATMCGGIDLRDDQALGASAREFLTAFERADDFGRVVGEPATEYLAPLSHDVVNERYVLDTLRAPTVLNRRRFDKLRDLALDVKMGANLVPFFTRAANDFPGHPTLELLFRQFGQEPGRAHVWLLLMANIIDRLQVPGEAKLGMFARVARGVDRAGAEPALVSVVEGLFLRILMDVSGSSGLKKWVREYEVASYTPRTLTVSAKEASEPTLASLREVRVRPRDYCEAVVEAFRRVRLEHKGFLATTMLLGAYHSLILHLVSQRPYELESVEVAVDEMVEAFPAEALVHAFRDACGALLMWGAARKAGAASILVLDKIVQALGTAAPSPQKAEVWSLAIAAGSVAGWSYDRQQAMLVELKEFSPPEDRAEFAASYAGAAVSLTYGFATEEQFRFAARLADEVRTLATKFSDQKVLDNACLAVTQLARYAGPLATSVEKQAAYDDMLGFARAFGGADPTVLARVLREMVILHHNLVNQGSLSQAKDVLADALRLDEEFQVEAAESAAQLSSLVNSEVVRRIDDDDLAGALELVEALRPQTPLDLAGVAAKLVGEVQKRRTGVALLVRIASLVKHQGFVPQQVMPMLDHVIATGRSMDLA